MSFYAYKCYYKEEAFRPANWSATPYDSVTANGDELIISGGLATRIFPTTLSPSSFNTIIFKAHGNSVGDSFLYTIYDQNNVTLYSQQVYVLPQYDVYVYGPISLSGTPYRHSFYSLQTVAIDFVAFINSSDVLTYVGSVLEMNVRKKTVVQKIPYLSDVIQTLGTFCPEYSIRYNRVPKSVFTFFEDAQASGKGVCFITPAVSFTGLIKSLEAKLEPGTIYYNVDVTVVKGDNEIF